MWGKKTYLMWFTIACLLSLVNAQVESLNMALVHLFICCIITALHNQLELSDDKKKIKLLTHTLFSNLPRPCSAKESITIIQTLPFTSALRMRPAHRGSLLDCRQHFILWTPARQKPFRPINRHRRLASPLCSLSLSFPPSLGDHSIKTVLFCQRSIVIRH